MRHAQLQTERSYDGEYMKIGKGGEETVINWVKQNPKVIGIVDFRQVRIVREADIDIGIKIRTGNIYLAEIKTDTYLGQSGNVLNEVLRINHTSPPDNAGYLGWTLRSPAKFLLYYAPNRNPPAIYKAEFIWMRRIIQEYTKNHNVQFNQVRTDPIKTTYNLLIPESEYENVFEIYPLEK